MAALGVLADQPGEREAWLWPDNVGAWNHWNGVATQWRTGMGGATGLDYTGVCAYLDEQGLPADERREVFAGIQACERATLEVWSEQRQRKAQQATPAGR